MGTPTIDRTSVRQYHDSSSSHIRKIGRFVGSTAYTAGGDPFTPAMLGMGTIDLLIMPPITNGTALLFPSYNKAAGTLQLFTAAGAEASGDTSGYSGGFEAIGF